MVGTRGGLRLLEDGRVLEVANVVWCTGFRHDFTWAGLPDRGPGSANLRRSRGAFQSGRRGRWKPFDLVEVAEPR